MRNLFILSFLFFFLFSCAKRVEYEVPQNCREAEEKLNSLLQLLSVFDVRDIRTRKYIKHFFADDDSLDMFIAKMTYELRKKNAYYGNFSEFKILGGRFEDGTCSFEVYFSVRKKYPLGIVEGETEISLFFDGERKTWFVKKPEYVGKINERKKFLFSPSIYGR